MSRIIITLETDNAAFAEDPQGEVNRILNHLIEYHTMTGELPEYFRDINGNLVGECLTTTDEKEPSDES